MTLMLRDPGPSQRKTWRHCPLFYTANRELICNDACSEFVHPDDGAAKFEDENLPDKVEDRGIMGAIRLR